jgi:ABC-type nitrate/sulfonate/bicarbonate transport system substrate-binding protein
VGYAYGFDAGDTGDRVAYDTMEGAGGPKVELKELNGAQNAVTALLRGDVDVVQIAHNTAVNAIAEGADIKVVLTASRVLDWQIVARPGILSPEDLRGKRIGTFPGTNEVSAFTTVVLDGAGLSERDVTFVGSPDSRQRLVALERGKLDAAVTEHVDLQLAGSKLAGYPRFQAPRGSQPVGAATVFAVSGKRLRENPEEVRRYVDGMLDGYAVLYARGGRSAFVARGEEDRLFGASKAAAGRVYDFNRKRGFWPRRGQPFTASQFALNQRFLKHHDIVEKRASFDEVWDTSFWR